MLKVALIVYVNDHNTQNGKPNQQLGKGKFLLKLMELFHKSHNFFLPSLDDPNVQGLKI